MNRQTLTPTHAKSVNQASRRFLQRSCSCGQRDSGGECKECNKRKQELQRRKAASAEAHGVPAVVHQVLRSPGQPLDPASRAFMEPCFGRDFSRVRVHTDAKAAESARAVNALAYTVGHDLVFDAGQYAPQTMEGRRLIAHELTHAVQQGPATARYPLEIGQPGDSFEREADVIAEWIGETAGPSSLVPVSRRSTALMLQRWSYGSGAPPIPSYIEVPKDERKRVTKAMDIVSKVVNDPKTFSTCHGFFKKHCPGETSHTLPRIYNDTLLWKRTTPGATRLASSVRPNNVAYTKNSYQIGRWAIAASMFHEFIHNCGVDSHNVGDDAKAACGKLPNL